MKKLLILALIAGSLLFPLTLLERGLTYDEALYLSIGRNLSFNFSDYTMNSSLMLYRPPMLPYVIGITSRLTGGFSEGISMIITPFFSFLLILSFYVVLKHFYNEKIAFFSTLFLLICPLYLRYSLRVLNHAEFAFFFFLSLVTFRKGLHSRPWWFILSGILGGLAFLTRYTGLMYFLIIGLYILLEKRSQFYREKGIYIGILFFFVPVIPWALFSHQVYNGYSEFAQVAMAVLPANDLMHTLRVAGMTIVETTPFLIFFMIMGIKKLKRDTFFVAYFAGAVLTLVLLKHREPRFILDFAPVFALSAGTCAASLYKKKKTVIFVVAALLCAQSVAEVVYTSQFELHIKEAGLFIASSPIQGAVMANEEAQLYYYTQRRIYFYPPSKTASESLLHQDVALLVINHCSSPPYIEELLQDLQWEHIFTSEKGCGASIYSSENPVFYFV
ncbi:MAG: glycosyltransferase family 39 protein [Theionarchaea archaeon]|nr:glycosyltransferase family 39 protein [Theionarchaea archaeon]